MHASRSRTVVAPLRTLPAPMRILIGCLLSLPTHAWSSEFHVCPTGDDAKSGAADQPWRTIAQVNAHAFAPGDRVLFQGGKTFVGNLSFDAGDAGTAASPVVVGSYGTGRATISAPGGCGLYAKDCSGFEVRDLVFIGPGVATSTASGISFYTDLPGGVKLAHLVIDHVDVSGFREGITVGSWSDSFSGFADVSVTHCACHDNARGGMSSYGFSTKTAGAWSHRDFYVGHCTFAGNPGDPAYTQNHSGSGVVLGQVDHATIERCVAHDNGSLCAHQGGGPVGIWAFDSNRVTIQFCESHHNHCGTSVDGGGFDLDGGSTDSVMQYDWSHDNDGSGYLVGDYDGSRPTSNNIVRYNVSQDDGRRNSYAGAHVYAGSGCRIFGNTLYASPSAQGSPSCLRVTGGADTRAWNNLLVSSGGARLIDCSAGTTLQGNAYWPSGGAFVALYAGTAHASLQALRSAGVEQLNGADVGMCVDPLLTSPGKGKTYDDADAIGGLSAYRLLPRSPMIDAGLDLKTLFAAPVGTRDYYGAALPQRSAFDIGAHELP